jgi:hypothetical protein
MAVLRGLPQRHKGVALADPGRADQRPFRLAAGLVEVDCLDHPDLVAVAGGDLRTLDLIELLGVERHAHTSSRSLSAAMISKATQPSAAPRGDQLRGIAT